MTTEARFRTLESIYAAEPVNHHFKPDISITLGEATISITVRPDLLHAGGVLHGSVYFKLLDDAATFAICSLDDEQYYLTASFHIHFLRPVASGRVIATGRVIQKSRRLVVGEATAVDENGRRLAYGTGTFMPGSAQ